MDGQGGTLLGPCNLTTATGSLTVLGDTAVIKSLELTEQGSTAPNSRLLQLMELGAMATDVTATRKNRGCSQLCQGVIDPDSYCLRTVALV